VRRLCFLVTQQPFISLLHEGSGARRLCIAACGCDGVASGPNRLTWLATQKEGLVAHAKRVASKVVKFGGTLLAGDVRLRQVAAEIASYVHAGTPPVVVVSAMGRAGDPYATDTLEGLLASGRQPPERVVSDLLLSCGETIAAAVVAHLLADHAVRALPMTAHTAGIRACTRFGSGHLLGFDQALVEAVVADGAVPVVTGFQGIDQHGQVATLGRGGSDVTAVGMGAALDADVEIVKGVPGVMTADPGLLPDARLLRRVRYSTLHQLALLGNRVVQAHAIKLGWQRRVRLLVRGLGCQRGTDVIMPDTIETPAGDSGWAFGLAGRTGLTMIRTATAPARAQVLHLLSRMGEDIDCSFGADGSSMLCVTRSVAERLLGVVDQGVVSEVAPTCGRVSMIADGAQTPGWLLSGADALRAAAVPLIAVASQGSGATFVVAEERYDDAVRELHHYAISAGEGREEHPFQPVPGSADPRAHP
jgi:aspartate kinase